jgi:hypothetical protein
MSRCFPAGRSVNTTLTRASNGRKLYGTDAKPPAFALPADLPIWPPVASIARNAWLEYSVTSELGDLVAIGWRCSKETESAVECVATPLG